jgi:hypothetical protein
VGSSSCGNKLSSGGGLDRDDQRRLPGTPMARFWSRGQPMWGARPDLNKPIDEGVSPPPGWAAYGSLTATPNGPPCPVAMTCGLLPSRPPPRSIPSGNNPVQVAAADCHPIRVDLSGGDGSGGHGSSSSRSTVQRSRRYLSTTSTSSPPCPVNPASTRSEPDKLSPQLDRFRSWDV